MLTRTPGEDIYLYSARLEEELRRREEESARLEEKLRDVSARIDTIIAAATTHAALLGLFTTPPVLAHVGGYVIEVDLDHEDPQATEGGREWTATVRYGCPDWQHDQVAAPLCEHLGRLGWVVNYESRPSNKSGSLCISYPAPASPQQIADAVLESVGLGGGGR